MAMEDFRVDVVIGKGPGATAIPLELPPFTLVGATTRAGLLPGPLRDRFGFTAHLEFYEPADLELIVRRSAGLLDATAHRRGRRRGRLAQPRHAPDRQPAAAPGPRLRPGAGRRRVHARRRPPGAGPLRGRPVRPRPARPRRPRRALPPLRRGPGRAQHPRGRRGGGAGDRRGGRRAVPGAARAAGPHPARAGRDAAPPGSTSGSPRRAAARRRCSTTRTPRRARTPADVRAGQPPPVRLGRRPRRPSLRHVATSRRRGPPRAGPSSKECRSVEGLAQLLPFVLIALVFWLLLIRPQRRRQQELTGDPARASTSATR